MTNMRDRECDDIGQHFVISSIRRVPPLTLMKLFSKEPS